ncbi:hypothetical protein HK097_004005 [Rhizophlyctis rosea]|uniref:Uncharacterized protein n=1 Tax=Rhizophlyctis rosea TaxID=64517 RepID=A0AAD5X5F4_9FUNG|nr:hypothetical protein HK097_004005 [Rhizophlyctis rosea]
MPQTDMSGRFVISLCADALAMSLRTLYQLHATTPDERSLRDKQAEKIVATWRTCELWLQLFPFWNSGTGREKFAEKVTAATDTLPSKLEACIEAIAKLKDTETYDLVSASRALPDVLMSLTPPPGKPFAKSLNKSTQFPDIVIKNIINWVQPSLRRQIQDTPKLSTLSLVSTAWNKAVKSKLASDLFTMEEDNVIALYIREAHFRTLSPSKRRPVNLSIEESGYKGYERDNNDVRLNVSIRGLGAICWVRALDIWNLELNAMTVVEWIAHSSSLTDFGLQRCKISGSVNLEDDHAQSAAQHLKKCVAARMTDNTEDAILRRPFKNIEVITLTSFVMQSFDSTLRSLELKQSLHYETVLTLDGLQFLDYHHTENQISFPHLPALKHLRIESIAALFYMAPSTPNPRLLDGVIWVDRDPHPDGIYAALKSLPSLPVLALSYYHDHNWFRIKRFSNSVIKYLREKGSNLTGLSLSLKTMPTSVFECVALQCPELTHLVIDFPDVEGLKAIVMRKYTRTCPKLRKIGLGGPFDDDAREWIRKLSEDLNAWWSMEDPNVLRSFGVYN